MKTIILGLIGIALLLIHVMLILKAHKDLKETKYDLNLGLLITATFIIVFLFDLILISLLPKVSLP